MRNGEALASIDVMRKESRLSRYLKIILKLLKNNLYINIVVIVVVSVSVVFWVQRLTTEEKTRKDLEFVYQAMEEDLKSNVLESKGEGCEMPQMDPFDDGVRQSEKTLPTGVCEGKDWVECFLNKCFVAKSVRADLKDVICVYREMVYAGDSKHHLGSPTTLRGGQTYRLRSSDFVQVSCVGTNRLRPGPQFKWSGHKAGLRRINLRKRSSRGPRFNVAILCFDAMSKNGFLRKMPQSHSELKKMGALILNGYNIVEGGTSGSLFPIFIGNETDNGRRFTDFFDVETCLFHRLLSMGYRTAYFGDSPVHGSFEGTYEETHHLPTDHHLLPLLYGVYGRTRANTRNFCFGDMPLYRLLLNLTYQFSRLNGNRFSFTFITDVNQENFNMGAAADADLAYFLRRLRKRGSLKKTMLFVMGAHGTSFTSTHEIPQLNLEDRLPLMAIVMPDRLKYVRPDAATALTANVDVLTTPFDIHSTLMDILGMGDQRNRYTVPGADIERGLTLLRPAGVAPHWCACAAWQPLPPRDPLATEIADLVADYINALTAKLRIHCVPRTLTSVKHVLRLSPKKKNEKHLIKIDKWVVLRSKYYQAKVVMSPGSAVYEATVRYYSKGDYFAITEQDISRVNSYSNESTCLTFRRPDLNKFCYCRS